MPNTTKQGQIKHFHWWTNTQGKILLSEEDSKILTQHNNIDALINYVYQIDKDAARYINSLKMQVTDSWCKVQH